MYHKALNTTSGEIKIAAEDGCRNCSLILDAILTYTDNVSLTDDPTIRIQTVIERSAIDIYCGYDESAMRMHVTSKCLR